MGYESDWKFTITKINGEVFDPVQELYEPARRWEAEVTAAGVRLSEKYRAEYIEKMNACKAQFDRFTQRPEWSRAWGNYLFVREQRGKFHDMENFCVRLSRLPVMRGGLIRVERWGEEMGDWWVYEFRDGKQRSASATAPIPSGAWK